MLSPFAARWPRLMRVEAAILFVVAVSVADHVPAVSARAAALAAYAQTPAAAWARQVTGWLALSLLVALPYFAVLLSIGGLLLLRKGYLFLSLLAVASWAASTFVLWPILSPGFPVHLSRGSASALATALALTAHMRPLIIGARDRGFVRMRLTAGYDEATTWRRPKSTATEPVADARPWVAPNPRGRATRTARGANALRSALPWGLIAAFAYSAYISRNQLAGGLRNLTSGVTVTKENAAGPDEAIAARGIDGRFVLDAAINGAGLQVVYDPQASFLTLNAETADRLGLLKGGENFSTLTRTSSGFVHVAPATIDTVTVGNITVAHVAAYIAKSGELSQNILGQSFLQRLASDLVSGNSLVLKGR